MFFSIIVAAYGYRHLALFIDALNKWIKPLVDRIISDENINLINFTKFSFVYSFIIGGCLLMILQTPWRIGLDCYPARAVEFIKINKLEGNLLVPFNWGSYALWKLYPQNLVSIDGRYEETYTNQAYEDLSEIIFYPNGWNKTEWEKAFYKYHHDVILMDKNSKDQKGKVLAIIKSLKNWKAVYEDKQAIVFIQSAVYQHKKYFLMPRKDENYYIKTKYENNINF